MDQTKYTTKITYKRYIGKIYCLEKESLSDSISLPEPPDLNSKYTMDRIFNLQDPLDNIPLSQKKKFVNFFSNHRKNDIRITSKIQKP